MRRSELSAHPRLADIRPRTAAPRWPAILARLLFLLALLSVVVTAAQAQVLGRLRRAVTDRVTPRPADAPRLEITTERIDVFLVAMQPVVAHAVAVQTAMQAQAAYETRQKQWEACKERVGRSVAGRPAQFTPAQLERVGELSIRNTQLMTTYQAAAASGNIRVVNAVQDSMEIAGMEILIMQYPALSACGMPAPRPLPPPPPPTPTQGEMIAESPGGMTGTQFGRLRELIAVYLRTGGGAPGFSSTEQSAFGERSKELAALEPLFRSGALEWSRWDTMGKNWRAK
jgi:hypothetical protein